MCKVRRGEPVRKMKYCCQRFAESVDEGKIIHSTANDETEWHMPEWLHIYFCPFCGANVKGKGFGNFDKEKKRKKA